MTIFHKKVVYSSGVDPVLMQFQPVIKNNASDQRRKWVKSIHRTSNTHDVRALACIGKRVSFLIFAHSDLPVIKLFHCFHNYI